MATEYNHLSILPCSTELEKSNPEQATLLYERAISENAGSYKLWHAYLNHRLNQLEGKQLDDVIYDVVNSSYERALVFMHKMPRIWIEYCTLLTRQLFVTRTRRAFNRALEALPITQHSRIWPLYLEFIRKDHVPCETAVRVFKRYMKLQPEDAEIFIDYLHANNRIDEAATLLCDIINRPHFQSKRNKTKDQLWEELCDMICEYADQIHSIDAEALLRDGIDRYKEQQGRLWNSLARYYIHLGMFANARNVYDEALNTVTTKKNYAEVWEAYSNFEEKCLDVMEQDGMTQEFEMRQTSYAELIMNNGLLSNRVALRQNPHNVEEWQNRVKLCNELENSEEAIEETYNEAIQVIDPKQADGKYEDLWIDYATFHEDNERHESACKVFERAIEAKYVKQDDLAKVWCAYIECEMKHSTDRALKLAKRAIVNRRNLRLWSIYADLEENFGTFSSTRAAYDRILDLGIATPQIILNYATFLEEQQYFEETFHVYERGVSLFKWPYSASIWQTYLKKFVSRYGYKKLDRTRDLLEQSLKDCPSSHSLEIFLLYAQLEEENGLLSRAQAIYTRGAEKVAAKDKALIFRIYLRSMMKMVDLNKIRSIYEQAIAGLDNKNARSFCLEYASFEEGLGEIDRARTVYSFCSQMCNPRSDREFWRLWADFEQRHGNLESIDEMLRIKRSIETLFPRPEFLSDVTIESETIAKAMENQAIEAADSKT